MCKASSSRRSFSLFSKAFICVCLRANFNDRLKLSIECPMQLLLVGFTRRISSVARFPQPSVSVFRACGGPFSSLSLSLSPNESFLSGVPYLFVFGQATRYQAAGLCSRERLGQECYAVCDGLEVFVFSG